MSDKIHVMIDLETLGMNESAVVLSIGAVAFSPSGLGDEFYIEINPDKYPGTVDLSTVQFWMEQERKGTKCPIYGTASMQEALIELGAYLSNLCQGQFGKLVIWANGTDFDLPKLCYMHGKNNNVIPWTYNAVRDTRTIYKLFSVYGTKPDRAGHHNALADAKWQAEYLTSILKNLQELCDVSEFF